MNLIIGAGLSGLSCSYHLGHENCLILEKGDTPFGLVRSHRIDGCTWDLGPHASFTSSDYVRDLFARSVNGEFRETPVHASNYYYGTWIDHPAQANLYQVPEPLRSRCVNDFLISANQNTVEQPSNYREWLEKSLGKTFAEEFPVVYTKKYWTLPAENLCTEWVGPRVFRPAVEDVTEGAKGPLARQTHYIKQVRYPLRGGYQSYAAEFVRGANIRFRSKVVRIDLKKRRVWTDDGADFSYDRLTSTMPLPEFATSCAGAPTFVREAAESLLHSQVLLVNIVAPHPTKRAGSWFYVYDKDKYSTRINCTETLSPANGPQGCTGVQVEVYSSRASKLPESDAQIAEKVSAELVEMGFLDASVVERKLHKTHTIRVPWANVIFDLNYKSAVNSILTWLETFGLSRENDDLSPVTDWKKQADSTVGSIYLAGRFGQWKYFWSDDCTLRGEKLLSLRRKNTTDSQERHNQI